MRESIAMPGSIPSMAVQKKQSVVPPSQGPLSTSTIDNQRVGHRPEGTRENGSHFKPSPPQTKKTTCSANKSIQICNATLRASAAGNGLNIDERLKAARERREEQQKLLVSRELSRLEREQRARRYYEQQLQERRKKFLEQRLKEERRRAAVEEKRKQRLREEKERHETAVRRTIEKSQKAQQQLSQSSRGRKLIKNAPRRLPLTTWERNLVSRLLTPTCSYLARSKSAACRSGEEASCQPTAATPSSAIITPKLRHQSVSVHSRSPASPSSANSQQRHISPAQIQKVRQEARKKTPNSGSAKRSPAAGVNGVKSPTCIQSRTASPSPERSPRRSISRHSTPLHLELPAVPEEDAAAYFSAGNTRPVSAPDKGQQQTQSHKLPDAQVDGFTGTAADGNPQPAEVMLRPSGGTTDPKEASRLLAEKRREARMQREKEEQERLQREEAERRSREEQQRRRAEQQARQEAEARRLVEEKKRREEEEQRRAEEERAQAMREAELLQKQREEELAKEQARAEQMKQEREIAAQKEEAERQARKKRLEEIMRRTRRTDSPDTKSVSARTLPKENTQPLHNGTIEDAAKTPVGTKTAAQLGLGNEDDVVPVVAFKERRSLRALSGLEEIQTKQRAEVI
ncbi:ensconsin isoform X2 [Poecilia reticulata]|uniref:ensconsin isoform X2 n=1 Tax=Poecilia reticulata TaxID=8081 RepID=UPI0004A254E6|nr:PREDICTED: ensconsin-like isoform X2 [Poecilia reticulata]